MKNRWIVKYIVALICLLSSLSLKAAQGDTLRFDDKSFFDGSIIAERSFIAGYTFNTGTPLNPQVAGYVQDYTRREGRSLEHMRSWGRPYFTLFDNILNQYNLPVQLKYLSVIESDLRPNLVSWAGAVGPWQLMPYEAHRFGLKTGKEEDERTDYTKSTHVAARLLRELHNNLGDWLLTIAAYNCGEGRVRQAIRKSGSHNFWDLQYYLPEETRTYVKKYIATHYIFEHGGGPTTMTMEESKAYLDKSPEVKTSLSDARTAISAADLQNSVLIELKGRYLSNIIIKDLKLSRLEKLQFLKWNEGLDDALAQGNTYSMRIVNIKADYFRKNQDSILYESVMNLLGGVAFRNTIIRQNSVSSVAASVHRHVAVKHKRKK